MSNVVKHHEPVRSAARAFDMVEVGEEAQAMIASAEETAARILEEARSTAEELRRKAWDRGFAEGKAALVSRIEEEIAAEIRRTRSAEVDALVRALGVAAEEVNRRRESVVREAKDRLIRLAVDVARVIVKREIAQSPEIARLNLEEAIRLSARGAKLIVRVNEADLETMQALLGEAPLGDGRVIEIAPSAEVAPGGCLVESASGSVDARIETQLREVEKQLLGEAVHVR